MRDFIETAKALAESNRVRILWLLKQQELCVCQIIEVLGLAPSTVSKHLSVLAHAKLVDTTKRGRWVYYRLRDGEDAPTGAKKAFHWVFQTLKDDSQIKRDRQTLAEVLVQDPEELCKTQAARSACC